MGKYSFVVASTSFILLLNLLVTSFPGPVQQATGLDTESLQSSTDISANVNASETSESNVLNQAGDLVSVYTKPQSQNRFLGGIFLVYILALIVLLIDLIWPG